MDTDESIAAGVQRGDIEAFGVLVERYEPKIKRYGNRFLIDKDNLDDLVQEIFIKAYVNIKSFDIRRLFSPWIYRIAHNEFISAIRKKQSSPFMFDIDTLLPHPVAKDTPDTEMQRQEMKNMIDRCLNKIDVKYREPLVLYYFEEMDYKEIADILHLPVATVGVRLIRAKAQLKKIITTIEPTYDPTR